MCASVRVQVYTDPDVATSLLDRTGVQALLGVVNSHFLASSRVSTDDRFRQLLQAVRLWAKKVRWP